VSRVNLTVRVPQVTTDLGLGFGSSSEAERCVVCRSSEACERVAAAKEERLEFIKFIFVVVSQSAYLQAQALPQEPEP
jgi:hypothetical protein